MDTIKQRLAALELLVYRNHNTQVIHAHILQSLIKTHPDRAALLAEFDALEVPPDMDNDAVVVAMAAEVAAWRKIIQMFH